jgi:type I restriction enzyme S subunit
MEIREGYKKTDVGFIPHEWDCVELSSVAKLENGKAHEKHILENGKYVVVNSKFISTEGEVKKFTDKGNLIATVDDTLIVMSDVPNGRAIAKCYYIKESNKYTVNQRIGRITPVSVNPILLFYKINRHPYYLSFDDGVKQTNLRKQDVLSLRIGLPLSSNEQQAIATALTDIDALISSLTKLIDKKKNIKQGTMQELLTGQKRLDGYSREWVETTLEALCYLITKQTGFDYTKEIKPSLKKTKSIDCLSFIQNKDFEGRTINLNTDFYIPKNIAYKYPNILLNEKCFLISISGRIGNVGVFNCDQEAFIGGAVGIARFINKSLVDWVMLYLQSNDGQKQILSKEKAGAQHNLTVYDVRKLKIPIPPKEEAGKIVQIIFEMDNEIEALELKLNKYKDIKQGMMQELLTGEIRLVEGVVR